MSYNEALFEFYSPKLFKRMKEDAKTGKFNWGWSKGSDEFQGYISGIVGRKIADHETINKTLREAENSL